VFKRAKTVHALDRAATVIGPQTNKYINEYTTGTGVQQDKVTGHFSMEYLVPLFSAV
jgi:hypothetical protein